MKTLSIDWGDLLLALDDHSQEHEWILDRETGEVQLVQGGEVVGDEGGLQEAFDADEAGERFLGIEPVPSPRGFRIMAEFAERVEAPDLQRRLHRALAGRKPFRSFKDELADATEAREEWFRFREEALEGLARRWLEVHGIEPEWRGR